MRWKDLDPDPVMSMALDRADASMPRSEALVGDREQRLKWSNAFADACARMIATEVRKQKAFEGLHVLPTGDGSAEPQSFVAGGRSKKIDVIVSSLVSGLQVGLSLKGMNFRDAHGLQFDKNLTGRTYELQDEVRVVHEYQPAAFLVGLYFLPLAATEDKRSLDSPSSFARAVEHLRARTGRLDPSIHSHLSRLDMSAVCLYVPGDREDLGDDRVYEDRCARGVARYFDVENAPPFRGRPTLDTTWSISEFVEAVVQRSLAGDSDPIEWADPEPD